MNFEAELQKLVDGLTGHIEEHSRECEILKEKVESLSMVRFDLIDLLAKVRKEKNEVH